MGRSCRRCCVGLRPEVWNELMEMDGSGLRSRASMARPCLFLGFKSIHARFHRFLWQPRLMATCRALAHCACTQYIHILLLTSSFVVLLHPFHHASPSLPRLWWLRSTPPPTSSPPHWFVRPRDPGRPPSRLRLNFDPPDAPSFCEITPLCLE